MNNFLVSDFINFSFQLIFIFLRTHKVTISTNLPDSNRIRPVNGNALYMSLILVHDYTDFFQMLIILFIKQHND